jgi:hypothetical protein
MFAVALRKWKFQRCFVAAHDEPCAERFALHPDLLYVGWKPSQSGFGVFNRSPMVGTPADIGWIPKAIGLAKSYGARIFAIGKRIATLEERVTVLEEKLGKQPGDTCPYCGERAMRKTHDGRILGSAPIKWKQDEWTCQVCRREETRIIKL